MNIKTSSARRMTLAVLTAGVMAAGVAGASSASATNIKSGVGKINYQGLALGKNIDPVTGIAAGNANFRWYLDVGVTKLRVTGDFSAVDRSGVPVRLQLKYFTGLNATGAVVSSPYTASVTPASDVQVLQAIDWAPAGAIGVQSAKVCLASDADRDGVYTNERCITSSL